jgi:Domain of unknown function (DUF6980)
MPMKKHCCGDMNRHTGRMCEEHDDPYTCPDYVISYSAQFDEYGLIVHDGGRSGYSISHCPFCGRKLAESKRDRWFEELENLGFDTPLSDDNIPKKFLDSSWYESP